ncbi:hypothetical protein HPB47_003489 [Ixodes persulcatus]|uniref:Uncharacterized protein n=1 Tax=Ixodes persulcatus TaxID=34615 RepID=A0AC60PIA9_IXOPE|nr:hypothetical protein HPB47_003489 [Ixodes persulcatus]
MEVTVEGTEITPETLREPGCLPAHRKHRHKSPDAETTPATRQQSTPSSKFRPRKLPPLPQLPAEDYKVVIRLQGGFNAKSWSAAQISDSIQHCAQLRSGADKDIIRTMPEQNIVIAIKIGARTYSSTTYVTAPDNSAKGVIHNIPSYDSPADIERSLERNTPGVLQARRLGETASVLIVFEGKSVPYYVNYRNTTYRRPHAGNKLQTKKLHHPLQDLASEGKAAPRTGALPLNQHTQVKGPLAVAVREDVVRVRVAAIAVPAVGED